MLADLTRMIVLIRTGCPKFVQLQRRQIVNQIDMTKVVTLGTGLLRLTKIGLNLDFGETTIPEKKIQDIIFKGSTSVQKF